MTQNKLHLNIYDHLGYITVGLYFIISVLFLYIAFQQKRAIEILNFAKIENVIFFVFSGFIIGHIIHAIATSFIKDAQNRKLNSEGDPRFDRIFGKAKRSLNLPPEINKGDIWQYCYLYVLATEFGQDIRVFNALYSLSRGIYVSAFMLFLVAIIFLTSWLFFPENLLPPSYRAIGYIFLFATLQFIVMGFFKSRKEKFFRHMNDKVMFSFDLCMLRQETGTSDKRG